MKKRIKIRKHAPKNIFEPSWISESKDIIIKLLIAIITGILLTITIRWGL